MQKLICCLVAASLMLTPASTALAQAEPDTTKSQQLETSESWMKCTQMGKADAQDLSTGGSFVGGLAGGLLLGLIGTGIAVLAQSDPEPSAAALSALEREECQYAYTEAFQSKGKSKKRTAALTGGLVGTAVLVVIIVAANSSSN